MAEKKAPEPQYTTIDGEEYETSETLYGGKTYKMRELGVKENREIEEAATDKDGKFNGQLHMMLALSKAIISPATEVDAIDKWPGKKYLVMSRAYNKLSSLPEGPEGNA